MPSMLGTGSETVSGFKIRSFIEESLPEDDRYRDQNYEDDQRDDVQGRGVAGFARLYEPEQRQYLRQKYCRHNTNGEGRKYPGDNENSQLRSGHPGRLHTQLVVGSTYANEDCTLVQFEKIDDWAAAHRLATVSYASRDAAKSPDSRARRLIRTSFADSSKTSSASGKVRAAEP